MAGSRYCICVNAPVMLPVAKSAENAAFPLTVVAAKFGVPGPNTLPFADPEKDAVPEVGMAAGGVSYPNRNCVVLDRTPELV